jgi:hypothetical protein
MPCATENEDYKLIKEVENLTLKNQLNLGVFNSFSKYASLYNSKAHFRRGFKGLGINLKLSTNNIA